MGRNYLGVDNGVSGSIALVSAEGNEGVLFSKTPVKKEQSYTKKKAQITRVDTVAFLELLSAWMMTLGGDCRAVVERPFVNPRGFKATASALRSLEATLICMEHLGFSYFYVDSKEWQKAMLPKGCAGPELKKASKDIGCRLFPEWKAEINKHGDADSLLIAEWARRNKL